MHQPRFVARWISLEALLARRTEWCRLSQEAIEPNPFYAPGLLAPAIQHRAAPGRTVLLIVEDQLGRLLALFPMQRPVLRHGLFGMAYSLYRDPLTCLTTPLIDRGATAGILHAALDALAACTGLLVMSLARSSGPVATLFQEEARRRNWTIRELESWSRPVLTYAGAAKGIRMPKDLQRRQKRLSGQFETQVLRAYGDDPRARVLFESFISLEKSGWKGASGSALAQNPAMKAIFDRLIAPAAAAMAPRLLIEALMAGDRPLALSLNLVIGRAGYTVKTTYDESFAAFSPGRLLDLASGELCAAGGPLDWFDSCAGPGHPLGDLWPERDAFSSMAVAMSPLGHRLLPWMERLQAALRDIRRRRHTETYTTRQTARSRPSE